MNPREKALAMVVVAVLVLGGLWVVVRWGVVARWDDLEGRIAKVKSQKEELETKLAWSRTPAGLHRGTGW